MDNTVKRSYVTKRMWSGVAPTSRNLEEMLRPPDILDEFASMGFDDPQSTINLQLKRRKPITWKDMSPSSSSKQCFTASQEWAPANEFGVVLRSPFKLYSHQVDAISWCRKREEEPFHGIRGGLLSIEMGLGKTLISLVVSRSSWKPNQCATLVLMPKTLMTNYMLDISKFFGKSVRALLWDRSIMGKSFFDFTEQTPYKNHVVIMSYDTVLGLAKSRGLLSKGKKGGNVKLQGVARAFYETPWYRVICDESHRFANSTSQLWEALSLIKPGRRICLTGTAVRNYEDDLFAQLKFCGLNILPDHRQWTIQNYKEYDISTVVYSKTMDDCQLQLPEKQVIRHYVKLSPYEKQVYNILMSKSSDTLKAFKSKNAMFANVLEMFTRLRQVCIAPHLIAPESKNKTLTKKEIERCEKGSLLGKEHIELENILRRPDGNAGYQSSKMKELVKIAKSIPKDEKMVIFSEWSGATRIARDALRMEFGDESAELVNGDSKDRDGIFAKFKTDPKVRFLCCTSVATHGLTLTEANHAMTLSTTWSSTTIEQFYARIWRIGQTKKCFMWQLVVKGSIESRMLEICETKHNIRDILLKQGISASTVNEFIGENFSMT